VDKSCFGIEANQLIGALYGFGSAVALQFYLGGRPRRFDNRA
jgi:hypothetical protein